MATTVAFFMPALATRFLILSIMPCTLVCGVVRSSQGVNMQNIVPLLLPPPPSILKPDDPTKCIIPGVEPTIFISFASTALEAVVEEASGMVYVTNNRPPSSEGTKPDGLLLNNKKAKTHIATSTPTIIAVFLILRTTPAEYFLLSQSKPLLNLLFFGLHPIFRSRSGACRRLT